MSSEEHHPILVIAILVIVLAVLIILLIEVEQEDIDHAIFNERLDTIEHRVNILCEELKSDCGEQDDE